MNESTNDKDGTVKAEDTSEAVTTEYTKPIKVDGIKVGEIVDQSEDVVVLVSEGECVEDGKIRQSKKAEAEAKLTPEQIEERIEKRRHATLLDGMNRKQRRAYLSGRKRGLSEGEALGAIRARR
jgi:hypothetical protein